MQNIFSWLTLKWKEIEPWKEGILGDTLRPCRARERERLVSTDTPLYSFKWSEKKWKFLLFIEGNQGKRLTFLFSLQQRAFEFTKIIFWTGFANTLFVARPWLLFLVISVLELLSHPAWIEINNASLSSFLIQFLFMFSIFSPFVAQTFVQFSNRNLQKKPNHINWLSIYAWK